PVVEHLGDLVDLGDVTIEVAPHEGTPGGPVVHRDPRTGDVVGCDGDHLSAGPRSLARYLGLDAGRIDVRLAGALQLVDAPQRDERLDVGVAGHPGPPGSGEGGEVLAG